MLPCSEQREQILRVLVQELMRSVLQELALALQLVALELQVSWLRYERQVVLVQQLQVQQEPG
jgi:hypothetical protein